ncbi:hypothetical protein ACFLFF_28775 [Brevibacillus reuszeri]
MSFTEINELRVRDLFDVVNAYSGSQEEDSREATQTDIDGFFGR